MDVESFITTVSDMFPKWFHKPLRQEIFVLVVCASAFLVHLLLITEVSFNRNVNQLYYSKNRSCLDLHMGFVHLCLLQGGIYIFQFFDYYGSSRICGNFIAICECLALGWMFGEVN